MIPVVTYAYESGARGLVVGGEEALEGGRVVNGDAVIGFRPRL